MDNPAQILNIPQGGLHIYGGLVLGAIALLVYLKKNQLDAWLFLDVAGPLIDATFTPAKIYEWYVSGNPGNILSNTFSVTVTPVVTTDYVLRIVDECDLEQYDTIRVIVDLFEPQIAITPSSAEVCPDVPVTFTSQYCKQLALDTWKSNYTKYNCFPNHYRVFIPICLQHLRIIALTNKFRLRLKFSLNLQQCLRLIRSGDACTGEEIQFTYSDDPTGKLFQWDFGDGASSTLAKSGSQLQQ